MTRLDVVEERERFGRIQRGIEVTVEIDPEVREKVRLGIPRARLKICRKTGEPVRLGEIGARQLMLHQRIDELRDPGPIARGRRGIAIAEHIGRCLRVRGGDAEREPGNQRDRERAHRHDGTARRM